MNRCSMGRPRLGAAWVAVLALLLASLSASGAEVTVKVVDREPPKELDAAVTARLQRKAVQVLEGGQPIFEFWLAAELSLTQKPATPAKALDAIRQPTLLGAVSVPKAQRDYRDDEIAAGVYTMRLAIQPNDGNHLGTSEFNWFAALIPAKHDPKPDGIADYKAMVKASSKETSTDHPVILSLRPAAGPELELPRLVEPAPEHRSVRVSVPGKAGSDAVTVVFEIVFAGKGHK